MKKAGTRLPGLSTFGQITSLASARTPATIYCSAYKLLHHQRVCRRNGGIF